MINLRSILPLSLANSEACTEFSGTLLGFDDYVSKYYPDRHTVLILGLAKSDVHKLHCVSYSH